ncbi:hypothetical protein PHLGIDRAFT_80251 [Phlebiopsis gigantea 11061_1 CR5-6]|uniref:XPG-I domain-containing protein n=1 Tax=Phlebiopsis gigantea (strain 11061_1 CR5-6) TaxID=745531 RepID=A0A0C3NB07_PHLG1|nr:hypothetical protein PHLGIDRAFT_80251 [Phlebiopsis gigantea 11061_1 CR5-6]
MRGPCPALRTIFYRLGRFASMPVALVVVFDGPSCPSVKRGKNVVHRERIFISQMKELIQAFGFHVHDAPGEAEAELAAMNRAGAIDAVLTDDSDVLVFGAHTVIRNPNVKQDQDNVRVYTTHSVASCFGAALDRDGLVLVAILSGGDYAPGLPKCGAVIAQGLARYGLGKSLVAACELVGPRREDALQAWRLLLQGCLRDDLDGHLDRRHPSLAASIPNDFPNADIVRLYTHPCTSLMLTGNTYAFDIHPPQLDLRSLVQLCEKRFGWDLEEILWKCKHYVWPAVALHLAVETINPDWKDVLQVSITH